MTASPTTREPLHAAAPDLLLALDPTTGVLRVAGDLDRSCAEHLTEAVHTLAATGSPVWTIDLHDLAFCDVEGLRVLHGAGELARSRQRVLRLLHAPVLVAELLRVVGPGAAAH